MTITIGLASAGKILLNVVDKQGSPVTGITTGVVDVTRAGGVTETFALIAEGSQLTWVLGATDMALEGVWTAVVSVTSGGDVVMGEAFLVDVVRAEAYEFSVAKAG